MILERFPSPCQSGRGFFALQNAQKPPGFLSSSPKMEAYGSLPVDFFVQSCYYETAESWKRFREEGLPHFLRGEFAGPYQQSLRDEFNANLSQNG